jgi:7,8-dihydropterin-6-yl-methyl-4-(beta-D-ribofuranosyl)aminobenzene 5'-phosphate synthase
MIGKGEIPLIVHPGVFKSPRYLKYGEGARIHFPRFTREMALQAGFRVLESSEPYPLLDGHVLFLGEIPRETGFEQGMPNACVEENGVEVWDRIVDDTSIVMNLKGKGLIILSGCSHAGIVNTVRYALDVTGIPRVHVVMGGFHLSGPLFEPIIDVTTEEVKKLNPAYVIPCHCTGRKAVMTMEREMPGQFILNMAGTTLTFAA